MVEEINVDQLIGLVELNVGNWKPVAVAIVDVNYKLWGEKGIVPEEFLNCYKAFPLSGLSVGDSINNSNSFLMKVTDKTGVIVIMENPTISRLATINLRSRLSELSLFHNLEKFVKQKEKETIFSTARKTEKTMW